MEAREGERAIRDRTGAAPWRHLHRFAVGNGVAEVEVVTTTRAEWEARMAISGVNGDGSPSPSIAEWNIIDKPGGLVEAVRLTMP